MRKVQSVSVEDRLTKGQRAARTGPAERLRHVILDSLKFTEGVKVFVRGRSLASKGGANYHFLVQVGSSGHVAAIAERIASACAAAGMQTPRVELGASGDLLSLDFGLVHLTIKNENPPLLAALLKDAAPTKAEMLHEAERVFANPEKASHWLRRPSQALGGRTPLAMLDSDAGIREVAEELGRIDHGMLS